MGLRYFPTAPDSGCGGWRRGRNAKSSLITKIIMAANIKNKAIQERQSRCARFQ
jgi:hypothetical protein